MTMTTFSRLGLLACAILVVGCAHSPVNDPSDPMEGMNRAVFSFNEGVDRFFAEPVAKGYTIVVPEMARTGVSNFFDNLDTPTAIVNDVLQGKILQSGLDSCRFVFNTVVGLAGFVDAASMIGLEKHEEDFGQTFGLWGIGNGAFIMLPLWGPTTNRDFLGSILSIGTNPTTYVAPELGIPLTAMDSVDDRSQLLGIEGILAQQLDRYIFVRNSYLQHRQSLVYDGNPPIEQMEFGDEVGDK
jgi:phospholipid-binding lipoprotein MlaA